MNNSKTFIQARQGSFEHIADIVTKTGLYSFAFGYVLSKSLANIGIGLLMIGFLMHIKDNWSWLKRDPLFILSSTWLGFVIFVAIRASIAFPQNTGEQLKSIVEVFSFGFIPIVAYAIQGQQRCILQVLILFLAGLILRILWDANLSGNGPFLDYSHHIFSTDKNFAAVVICAGFIGLLLFAIHHAIYAKTQQSKLSNIGILLLFVFIVMAWSSVKSRASWISLGVSIIMLFFFFLIFSYKQKVPRNAFIIFLILIGGIGIFVATIYGKTFIMYLVQERETWQAILNADWDKMPKTSIGFRIYMWRLALNLWLQHPFFGWGTSVAHLLASNEMEPAIRGFNNFHNAYLEILVRTGLVGGLFFLTAAILVFRSAYQAYKIQKMSVFLFIYLLEVLILFLLNNLSVSFLFAQHGWQYVVLFGSLAYSYRFVTHSKMEATA